MVTQTKKNKASGFFRRHWPVFAAAGIYLVLLALHVKIQPYADDIWYAEEVRKWNFFALQAHYYLTWSGRVVSSALSFLLLDKLFWLWRLLNPLLVMALAFGMARAAVQKPTFKSFGVALLLLFVLGPGVADYSIFWATGSLYYLWPTAAALFALHPFFDMARALPALRPAFALTGTAAAQPPPVHRFPARLALVVPACLGNEALTLCVVCFMAVVLAEYSLRTKRLAGRHLALLAVAVACAVVVLAAPGSQSRYQHESRQYLGEYGVLFTKVPLAEKLSNGLAWMFDMVLTTLFPLLVVVFAVVWHRYFWKKTGWVRWVFFALLGFSVALAFPARADAMFAFEPLGEASGLAALLPYAYWTLFLAAAACLLAKRGRYYALGFAAAACTALMMIFSPTIYFSGERTMFTAGVILGIMVLGAFEDDPPAPAVILIACLAATSGMRLVSRLALFYG